MMCQKLESNVPARAKKRRDNFELSTSLNVIFISASSDGSASISGNRSWEFQGVIVPDGWLNVPLAHWLLEDKSTGPATSPRNAKGFFLFIIKTIRKLM
jgi:hypothetical protein